MELKVFSKGIIRQFRTQGVESLNPFTLRRVCDNLEFARRVHRQRKRDKRRQKTPTDDPRKYLTTEQFAKLIQYLDKHQNSRDITNKQIVILLAESGLRVETAIKLKFADTVLGHEHSQIIWIKKDKGGAGRKVVISKFLENFIKKIAETRGSKTGFVLLNEAGEKFGYTALYERIKRLGKKVGIPWLHPHILRHTFGTYLKAATGDFYFVIEQLGHKRKDTTSIYAKTPDDEAVSKMERFHNRLWCEHKEGFLPFKGQNT